LMPFFRSIFFLEGFVIDAPPFRFPSPSFVELNETYDTTRNETTRTLELRYASFELVTFRFKTDLVSWSLFISCRPLDNHHVAWVYYVFAVVFDITTTGIAMFYMIRFDAKSNLMLRLKRLLITHGLAYFVSLTAVNALNLSLYLCYDDVAQSAAVPLSHALVWILSQRILIDLHDLSLKGHLGESEKPDTVVICITGSTTSSQNGNGRTIERQRGSSKSTTDSDIQVRIQRRSRQSRHTTRDSSHDTPSPAASIV